MQTNQDNKKIKATERMGGLMQSGIICVIDTHYEPIR